MSGLKGASLSGGSARKVSAIVTLTHPESSHWDVLSVRTAWTALGTFIRLQPYSHVLTGTMLLAKSTGISIDTTARRLFLNRA